MRKTAAICVAKLYDLKPELAIDNGFLETLKGMVSDANPMVVANAVTALTDIHVSATQDPENAHPKALFAVNSQILGKLLIALNECSEWGRVAILTQLARYKAIDEKESEHICERVVPQFQHANGAVVLSAVKVCLSLHLSSRFSHVLALNYGAGNNDSHPQCATARTRQTAHPQDGSSTRHPRFLRPGSSMGGLAKYQSSTAKAHGHPPKRDARILLQV